MLVFSNEDCKCKKDEGMKKSFSVEQKHQNLEKTNNFRGVDSRKIEAKSVIKNDLQGFKTI